MKLKRIWKVIITLSLLLIIIIIFGISIYNYELSPVDKKNKTDVVITIKKGTSTQNIIKSLKKADLIRSEGAVLVYLKLNKVGGLQASSYKLNRAMSSKEIIKIIENICPERLAYSWDNVGLLCGDENKDVKKVFVTLDTNINTIKEAISKNADMIISHHPILLGGIKRIDYSTSVGQMLKLLIENNIPLFAAHTNMDTA